jgi:hypothetical protein
VLLLVLVLVLLSKTMVVTIKNESMILSDTRANTVVE